MEEFAKLFLTGRRAESYARFRRIGLILAIVSAALALIPVFFSMVTENLPLTVTLSALGILLGAGNVGLQLYGTAYMRGLASLQREANALELRGEEASRMEKVYSAWEETLGRRHGFQYLSIALTAISYIVLFTAVILCAVSDLPEVSLFVACLLFGVLAGVASAIRTVSEGRARAAFYERAEREIGELKREKLGVSEKKISAEAENARGFSEIPVSVAMFLKEDVEKEDFRALNNKSSIIGFSVGFALGVGILLPIFISGVYEKLGPVVSWLLPAGIFAAAFGVLFCTLLPIEARKKEVYRRNLEKLGDGEADAIRKQLQAAWIRSQKAGNGMFFGAFALPVALGIILGLIQYFNVEGAVLVESIGTFTMACLIPAAFLAFVIWAVMFAVYRKKVRPLEALLKQKLSEEEP